MKAQAALDALEDLLQDAAAVRWPPAQRLRFLNEGQLAIVSVRPDANAKTGEITLVAGELQTLPAEGVRLLDILRNVGGRGVTIVSRDAMTDLNTNWFAGKRGTVIKHYAHDPRIPREFHVYPPAVADIKVQGRYSVLPTPLVDGDTDLSIDGTFMPALVSWAAARCFAKDTDTQNLSKSGMYMAEFKDLVGVKTQSDKGARPSEAHPNRIAPEVQ